ncbi:nucleotidyl transferase AbiEii/AbiGii toxin family protein [Proteus mirabilis]|uniref:nucleotidyl transferase AbiEii/AbiGii toxin family protein n=1 Tax=Proteus mirabilis TaxID=584 RepID=UPI0006691E5F|nr:nucleotidyl transferase AbiEii/AbiGii toxin family protein [Proteus mirabilis]ELZ9705826.1 nucleotidyl transferase AbiEii/AbiGii toxin family protein [Proteus mirabilis]MBB6689264.1 nucleotidyl transferase AbiEii/AbiGii toxin family protein [Proteus mirabilis]MBG2907504.1 nucleotidyl transferase AbiEii/AbiGii toxin family protein [Proteus mirabilis]MBG2927609.1 nucleotidyl transferase AbiEii/AbiGii toxin family protein [Proteus mirabilis]MBG3024173.1 nucleotidyl transferase AbiEii/AbiGii to
MDRNSIYYKQVQLLIQVLPFVAKQQCFALKGGTAINLFVRDFPRLSVDIDLVYLPMKSRDDALQEICDALDAISSDLKIAFKDIELTEAYRSKRDALRLIVARNGVQIKVELSPVLRGTVYEPKLMEVCASVEDEFGYVKMPVVDLADLYAGKICAALDRQHPRDLFDVKWLLENEGLTDEIRKALLVYLSSHNRPMVELLSPQFKDITAIYEGEFTNMAETDVPLAELEAVRVRLVDLIHQGLTDSEKSFLLSFKNREPDWSLIGLDGVSELPAIKWKQINLANMPNDKHTQALEKLKGVLGV